MDYLFEKLHQVRSLREQTAQSDLAQGRQRLDRAEQQLSAKRKRLARHRRFQSKMQAQLFTRIDHKTVTLNEFQTYRGRINDLQSEEKACRQRVHQAETRKDSARANVERLAAVFHQRRRQSAKLEPLRSTWKTRIEQERNRRAEEELEEMVANRFSLGNADS